VKGHLQITYLFVALPYFSVIYLCDGNISVKVLYSWDVIINEGDNLPLMVGICYSNGVLF